MKARILLCLIFVACRPRFVLDPVYDCTTLTQVQQKDMSVLLEECESWECHYRVLKLYCEEES